MSNCFTYSELLFFFELWVADLSLPTLPESYFQDTQNSLKRTLCDAIICYLDIIVECLRYSYFFICWVKSVVQVLFQFNFWLRIYDVFALTGLTINPKIGKKITSTFNQYFGMVWLSVCLRTKWLWDWVQFQSLMVWSKES